MTKDESLEILERDDKRMLSGHFSIDDFKAIEKLKETVKDLSSCGEAISREEAILQIQRYGVGCLDSDDFTPETCERFVINLLKKLPTVCARDESQCEYVADCILDQIRKEVEALPKTYPFVNHIDMYVKVDEVMKIISKYKA